MVTIETHPLLDAKILRSEFPVPLREMTTEGMVLPPSAYFDSEATAPVKSSNAVRLAVRNLLRHGGFKPTGRSKPASEYLIKAAANGKLSSINLAVDVCNAVSLHSGLPISVIDPDLASPPFRLAIAKDESYVFNRTGQEISLDGLLCLFDAQGPCGNAVKDSQRTKTSELTRSTISVIWGTVDLPGHTEATATWYQELIRAAGASVEEVS